MNRPPPPKRTTFFQAFTACGQPYPSPFSRQSDMIPGLVQPYISSVSQKRQESWTHVILLPGFGFDHKQTTENNSDLNWSHQQ
jgi:hypothetical protein